ncbi:hypothetical protein ACJ73_00335 [Blastomyces percursus]|uniref:Ras-GEF domain-containing protein n=1 Tax=Blastomyces percursus TaxID=1658174 RepID=A0A1J9QID6_9EURO|nr:hypothetical protein ACJ73_00335 [Blastomyces percursus]
MTLFYNRNTLRNVNIKDAHAVAEAIDEASWSAFKQVPFSAWVFKATQRPVELVDEFIWFHKLLAIQLQSRLRRYQILHELSELARNVNPFARSVIYNRDVDISFIVEPLSCLPHSTIDSSEALSLLEKRFRRLYHSSQDLRKKIYLRTDMFLFHGIKQESPASLAWLMTENDSKLFSMGFSLSLEGKNMWFKNLGLAWDDRSYDVVDTLCLDSKYAPAFIELATCLYRHRNFHGSTAIVQGLKNAGFNTAFPSALYAIFDPANNYQTYRQMVRTGRPAIPFVFPLKREHRIVMEKLQQPRLQLYRNEYRQDMKLIVDDLLKFRSFDNSDQKPYLVKIIGKVLGGCFPF